MILLEPCDLEDLDSAQALDAVAADIRAHQATPDAGGFFTATRHTSLLAALLVALHGEALHHLDKDSATDRHRAGPLTTCASHVATALAHYSQAAIPFAVLAATQATTLAQQLDGVEQYGTAAGDIHAASRALDRARAALTGPARPLARDTAALPGPSAGPTTAASGPAPAVVAERPRLTKPQEAALRAIGAGGVTMYESGRNGPLRISAGAGVRITMPTYDRLESLGFVGRDTRGGLYGGQKLYATATGRIALAALTTTAAPKPPAPPSSSGARRR